MYNSQMPSADELPSSRKLALSTLLAAGVAGALLVAVVLPAEYGVDPTGIGRTVGLTQMGEIKAQLAEEAARDEARDKMAAAVPVAPPAVPQVDAAFERRDVMEVALAPGQGTEIKVTAARGSTISFDWSIAGGHVNYDTHADAPGIDYHGYGKGKQSTGERGQLVAAFDGNHGWFWRNRSEGPVKLRLRTAGAYTQIKKVV